MSNVDSHSCHLLFGPFQFTLIHGPSIPCSYAILFFIALDFTSITSHILNWSLFCFGSAPSFCLDLFFHPSPVVYWAPTNLESSSFSILFAFSYCPWGSQDKNAEVVCHSLLQWTTFYQNSWMWPIHLGWLIVSLGQTRLWSIWSFLHVTKW